MGGIPPWGQRESDEVFSEGTRISKAMLRGQAQDGALDRLSLLLAQGSLPIFAPHSHSCSSHQQAVTLLCWIGQQGLCKQGAKGCIPRVLTPYWTEPPPDISPSAQPQGTKPICFRSQTASAREVDRDMMKGQDQKGAV